MLSFHCIFIIVLRLLLSLWRFANPVLRDSYYDDL